MNNFVVWFNSPSIKKMAVNRLNLAKQSHNPTIILKNIFPEGVIYPGARVYVAAIERAGESKENFAAWFKQLVSRACLDLFTIDGEIKKGIKEISADNWRALSEHLTESQLKRCLIYAYCNHCLTGSANQNKEFNQQVQGALENQLNDSVDINTVIATAWEAQDKRALQTWRWALHCATNIKKHPRFFWQTMLSLRFSFCNVFASKGEVYNLDRLGEFINQSETDKKLAVTNSVDAEAILAQLRAVSEISYIETNECKLPDSVKEQLGKLCEESDLVSMDVLKQECVELFSVVLFFIHLACDNIDSKTIQEKVLGEVSLAGVEPILEFVDYLSTSLLASSFIEPKPNELATFVENKITQYRRKQQEKSLTFLESVSLKLSLRETLLFWFNNSSTATLASVKTNAEAVFLLNQLDEEIEQILSTLQKPGEHGNLPPAAFEVDVSLNQVCEGGGRRQLAHAGVLRDSLAPQALPPSLFKKITGTAMAIIRVIVFFVFNLFSRTNENKVTHLALSKNNKTLFGDKGDVPLEAVAHSPDNCC